ncbi:MAG: electron transfer flavoprotein-ubiquinone oxidoreductase [bacterium]|nr:electron transfer flavoprotein-ubiquinone oxidoreductase [bacterium]
MQFDIVIVGAGPAGLSAAIQLKQLALQHGREISVCVVEKGAQVGAHILSGAILETRALDELMPDWQQRNAPLKTQVTKDQFLMLSKTQALPLPVAASMRNAGNYIISLGEFCRWLAIEAEALGVEIYPGFAAASIIYHDGGAVKGVATGDMGLLRDGSKGPSFQRGMELRASYTFFAEGCRGHLGKQLMEKFDLRANCDPQIYGIGIKELWEIKPENHRLGEVLHTIGWPLKSDTYGGSFLYHQENNVLSLGLIVGLDYPNPHLSPYEELQRFKFHPSIKPILEGGRRITYGARALNEGGLQSIPKMSFPGGCLIGCEAGFLNVAKIKGTHTAMKSGMLAAEAAFVAIACDQPPLELDLQQRVESSWIWRELTKARNIRPGFAKGGLWGGLAHAALDTYMFLGSAPWTLHHHGDHETLKSAAAMREIFYLKADGVISFDKATNLSFAAVSHEEDQPCHLQLKDEQAPLTVNLARYDGPEVRYCPAGVYEYVEADQRGQKKLLIHAQNCIHCKCCDIKDPGQNINWVTPNGGEGPNYVNM